MAATFALDTNDDEGDEHFGEPLYCTTVLPVDRADEKGHKRVNECRAVMYPPAPKLFAFTITGAAK